MSSLKPLVIILFVAVALFVLLKPMCLKYVSESDFDRRRNVWLYATAIGFFSPTLWIYFGAVVPVIIWAVKRDSNPLAFYSLLLYVVPNVTVWIPNFGLGTVIEISYFRMLAFVVLLPMMFRLRNDRRRPGLHGFSGADFFLISYCLLQVVLSPYVSPTQYLRSSLLHFIDVLLVFYVFSRGIDSKKAMVEILLMHALAFAIYSPLAVLETARSWLLYGDLYFRWDDFSFNRMLYRNGRLRAQLTTGHALGLGYLSALAFGFWLIIGAGLKSRLHYFAGALWFWMGLIAAYSRGPWITAASIFLVFLVLQPKATSRVIKSSIYLGLVGAMILASPMGEKVVDSLPFIGTVESSTVDYRQDLLDVSMELIMMKPFFGDPHALERMEELRDGLGIIDLVNGYVQVALFYGLVTLSALMLCFLVCCRAAWRATRISAAYSDPSDNRLGVGLLASIAGTLVYLGTSGFEHFQWMLLGMLLCYARLTALDASQSVEGADAPREQALSSAQ